MSGLADIGIKRAQVGYGRLAVGRFLVSGLGPCQQNARQT
jgi:hypothetical protein